MHPLPTARTGRVYTPTSCLTQDNLDPEFGGHDNYRPMKLIATRGRRMLSDI